MSEQNQNKGCGSGCANIPISVILLFIGGGFWWFRKYGLPDIDVSQINSLLERIPGVEIAIPVSEPTPPPAPPAPTPSLPPVSIVSSPQLPPTPEIPAPPEPSAPTATNPEVEKTPSTSQTAWEKKALRGIYLSRYQVTNNASEQMIRDRVRYYHAQGFNTIIHGVWGNACTMYKSEVMEQTLEHRFSI